LVLEFKSGKITLGRMLPDWIVKDLDIFKNAFPVLCSGWYFSKYTTSVVSVPKKASITALS